MLQRVGERNGDRMSRTAFVRGVELALPLIQRDQSLLDAVGTLVRDVVRDTAERIRGVNGAPFDPRKEAEADGEVAAVLVSDGTTVVVRGVDVQRTTSPSGGTFISVSRERHQ
jgi:hypothetical protein